MKIRSFYGWIAILSLAALAACSRTAGTSASIPHLEKQGTATRLVVDGKPFLMLAGELRNSSGSSLDFVKPLWPQPGRDASQHGPDPGLLGAARTQRGPVRFRPGGWRHPGGAQSSHLRLVFLWFGSWKNGVSS